MTLPVSIDNAEHYFWGTVCDGWHLLNREDLSLIQERVPPGGREVNHYHKHARQFFYILEGEGVIAFQDREVLLKRGMGLEIPPGVAHQFLNNSQEAVSFLVVSLPPTRGDRVEP